MMKIISKNIRKNISNSLEEIIEALSLSSQKKNKLPTIGKAKAKYSTITERGRWKKFFEIMK